MEEYAPFCGPKDKEYCYLKFQAQLKRSPKVFDPDL